MNFKEYAENVASTAGQKIDFDYHTPAITGEAGEVAELFKKYKYHDIRIFGKQNNQTFLEALTEELGDVLWGVVNCANYFGLDVDEIVRYNCEKRAARYPNGFVPGGGIRVPEGRGAGQRRDVGASDDFEEYQ